MRFLRAWLRVDRPQSAAVAPSKAVDVPRPFDEVFDRCVDAIENVLGGTVAQLARSARAGTIEATFGLAFSERLTCTLEASDDARTRVRIESRRGARTEPLMRSDYVDRLAQVLISE
jgi:hypothetical protein